MIKFSWKKINDKLDWDERKVITYFFLKRNLKVPTYLYNRYPPAVILAYAKRKYPKGDCYILNIDDVLQHTNITDVYLYLELASKRNVFDYHMRKITHLPILLVEEYQIERAKFCPLLKIENDNIYFKYEQEK